MRWRSAHTAIGVDIGTHAIKAAQLVRAGGAWRLAAGVVVRRVDAAPVADYTAWVAMRDAFERAGFRGERIVLSGPSRSLRTEMLELPPRSSGAPVDQLARSELARVAKLDSAPFEFACWDLPAGARASTTTTVMATALADADAEALIAPCEMAGLNVVAIDTQAWAMVRATSRLQTPESIAAIVDLGWSTPSVALVANGTPVYQRSLGDVSMALLHRTVTSECKLQDDEAAYALSADGPMSPGTGDALPQLARVSKLVTRHAQSLATEIEASLTYAAHRYTRWPVSGVFVTGGGALVAGLVDTLGQQLGVPTRAIVASDIGEAGPWDGRADSGLLVTAMGLAMHGEGAR